MITENINYFFGDFATEAVFKNKTVYGIFDVHYSDALETVSRVPLFTCQSDDVSDVAERDLVEINDKTYEVVEAIQQDDTNKITILKLALYA